MADDIDPQVPRWLGAFAESLGLPAPTDQEIADVLALAATAARGSARQAAPVACWLAARSGGDLAEAGRIASTIT